MGEIAVVEGQEFLTYLRELAANTSDIADALRELPNKIVSEYIHQMQVASDKMLAEL